MHRGELYTLFPERMLPEYVLSSSDKPLEQLLYEYGNDWHYSLYSTRSMPEFVFHHPDGLVYVYNREKRTVTELYWARSGVYIEDRVSIPGRLYLSRSGFGVSIGPYLSEDSHIKIEDIRKVTIEPSELGLAGTTAKGALSMVLGPMAREIHKKIDNDVFIDGKYGRSLRVRADHLKQTDLARELQKNLTDLEKIVKSQRKDPNYSTEYAKMFEQLEQDREKSLQLRKTSEKIFENTPVGKYLSSMNKYIPPDNLDHDSERIE